MEQINATIYQGSLFNIVSRGVGPGRHLYFYEDRTSEPLRGENNRAPRALKKMAVLRGLVENTRWAD